MAGKTLPRIAVIGAGRSGTAVARAALARGYVVRVANSHGGDSLRLILDIMAPGALPSGVREAIAASDIVLLAIPLKACRTLPVKELAGKVVIDMMNYWREVDGTMAEFESHARASSEIVKAFLPASRLVKTLNHIDYSEITDDARPPGSSQRRALAASGDDPGAKAIVSTFVENLGFDVVDAGTLSQSRPLEPGNTVFNGRFTLDTLRTLLCGVAVHGAGHECLQPMRCS